MPKLTGDFSKISDSFQPLPPGDYRVNIEAIEEGLTKENQLPSLSFKLKVTDGEFDGRLLFDNVTLQQKDGKRNDIGWGRVKGYAIAVLGDERANSPDGIDTDELINGDCQVVVSVRQYTHNGETKTSNDVKKVLAL